MTDVSVHIHGENGTGKELVADAMTQLGARSNKPFLKLNCSAIPTTLFESALFGHTKGAFTGANKDQEGFIERAEGGTLFLDEIGDISLDMQVKLLRVLQSGEFSRVGETTIRKADIRIITATNRNLKDLVAQGKIREDFYYRINVFPLTVPSLRERGEDVLLIAEHYRTIFNQIFSKQIVAFSDDVKRLFVSYQWPGNVRELENILKRAFVLVQGDSIGLEHLSTDITQASQTASSPTVAASWESATNVDTLSERDKILAALRQAGGNKGQAANLLGMSRVTLWKKMVKLDLNQPDDDFASSIDDSKDLMTA
jgi:transcriptional regulator with PAS, ATPase and Fis domain